MNCELIWVKMEMAGSHPLYFGAFYKPKADDAVSLLELRKPLDWLGVKRVTEPNQRIIPDGAYGNFRLLRYRVLPPSPNRTNKWDINCLFY